MSSVFTVHLFSPTISMHARAAKPARWPLLVLIGLLTALVCVRGSAAEDKPEGGWSAELLNQILKDDAPSSQAPAVAAAPLASPELVLHTYPLSNLRVAEAGKSQNVIAILNKLLPAGSSMKTDVAANSLHILTTEAAHKAVWDYLSAVDVAESAPVSAASVPEEVKSALKKLAESSDHSKALETAIGALHADVSRQLAEIDTRERHTTFKLIAGGVALGLLLVVLFGWTIRRSPAAPPPGPAAALVLAPDQLAGALVPVHDKMRTDMLGLLNEVAIKLQAQHQEQQTLVRDQQRQLEDARHALAEERKQFISEAGTMVVQAVERVDATTAKLAKQQDKVAELVEELQTTVRELDDTKDSLRDREIELEQERAKIAALSLLLEEGAPLPPIAPPPRRTNGSAAHTTHFNGADAISRLAPATPCITHEPITLKTAAIPEAKAPTLNHRFTFLPPDHPET